MRTEPEQLQELATQLDTLYQDAVALEKQFSSSVELAHSKLRESAKNLLHYLALRQHDIRALQERLAELGLSSLGRAEGHVLASLQAVQNILCQLLNREPTMQQPSFSFSQSKAFLDAHTHDMLGEKPPKRNTRIMVTLSADLASNPKLLNRMLQAGMNCARINCAHDNASTWATLILSLRQAEQETGISCKVLMDLAGPKLRTGPLRPGPKLLYIQPVLDALGKTTAPVSIWIAAPGTPPPIPVDAALPLQEGWFSEQPHEGGKLYFKDTRGRKRTLLIVQKYEEGVVAHLSKSSYIATGTEFHQEEGKAKATAVGDLPALEVPILLRTGDLLELTREAAPGAPAQYDDSGRVVKPAHISCTLPEVFEQMAAGQAILFDDGKITGHIEKATKEALLIKITNASPKGSKLRSDAGINLPESNLRLEGLTEKDKQDLTFIAKHADIVNLSFVNAPATLEALHEALRNLGADNLAVMVKIETQESFRNLPLLLLAAMRRYPTGIMIARGDLAVECGWQRLAEVQEEILWLCEAAQIPVVWATQVLESLAKKGRPSRAEITDAAMSQRADCVMLNKGPHLLQAITLLDGILTKMQEHQHKKTSMLRSLHVSDMEAANE